MNKQIVVTSDGSHSLFVPELNEHYHSVHGAIQESQHVFIEAGLKALLTQNPNSTTIQILEIGMGTGLNVLLSQQFQANNLLNSTNYSINYTAIESHPLPTSIAAQLNYHKALQLKPNNTIFNRIHAAPWHNPVAISPSFTLTKIHNTLQKHTLKDAHFDLVYFDAFAPDVQAELWTPAIFEQLYAAMLPNAILTTYCAKGTVKRALRSVGFSLEALPGPPGKREMTRAKKIL